jgi:glyoxylase-like metal-dependent hydrolase (beta-lactamase superfamily II)
MEQIAEGVHLVRGGLPRVMNVYLIEDEGGVTLFDAGIRSMAKSLIKAAAPFGGIKRVVLGHSHMDHRGSAPAIAEGGVPVYCHAAELDDARTDGGMHYFKLDLLNFPVRQFMRHSLVRSWDAGPVPIEDTLAEGDQIAGFDVIHLPGHAPGLIGLHRERDGLVLGSDAIYTINPLNGRKGAPRIPLEAFNMDTEMAKASALKLSAVAPRSVWLGHGDGFSDDAPGVLEELGRKGGVLGA